MRRKTSDYTSEPQKLSDKAQAPSSPLFQRVERILTEYQRHVDEANQSLGEELQDVTSLGLDDLQRAFLFLSAQHLLQEHAWVSLTLRHLDQLSKLNQER